LYGTIGNNESGVLMNAMRRMKILFLDWTWKNDLWIVFYTQTRLRSKDLFLYLLPIS
jgi:hypothetical protein